MGTEKALIFGSARCDNWDFLAPLRQEDCCVVCADGGLLLAREAGFLPDFYIGDSDSGGHPEAGLTCELLPAEKDLTDLQAAYSYCLRTGIREIAFTACTGGRQDHHLANLALLERAYGDGVQARMLDADNEITYLPAGRTVFSCDSFRYFGIVPLDRALYGLTIENAKYPLRRATARRGDSLTISNEPRSGPVTITLERGSALLVRSGRIK